jgi:hypothetical protein
LARKQQRAHASARVVTAVMATATRAQDLEGRSRGVAGGQDASEAHAPGVKNASKSARRPTATKEVRDAGFGNAPTGPRALYSVLSLDRVLRAPTAGPRKDGPVVSRGRQKTTTTKATRRTDGHARDARTNARTNACDARARSKFIAIAIRR